MSDLPENLPGPEAFATLPLTVQIDLLAAALGGADPRPLIRLAGAPPDPAPLVWLLVILQDDGWLDDPAAGGWLADYLAEGAEERAEIVMEALADAVEPPQRVGLERLAGQLEAARATTR